MGSNKENVDIIILAKGTGEVGCKGKSFFKKKLRVTSNLAGTDVC